MMKTRTTALGLTAMFCASAAFGADATITLESVEAAPGTTARVGITIDASDLIGSLSFDAIATGLMVTDVDYDGLLFSAGWDGWDTAASSTPNIQAACIFPRDQVTGFQQLFTLEVDVPMDAADGSTIAIDLTDAFVTDYRFLDYDLTVIPGEIFVVTDSCAADLVEDGTVGILDLLTLLESWGTADSAADLDADGTVAIGDIFFMLEAWGDCE